MELTNDEKSYNKLICSIHDLRDEFFRISGRYPILIYLPFESLQLIKEYAPYPIKVRIEDTLFEMSIAKSLTGRIHFE